ncbi:MAG: lipoyl synthase [Myxococcota bacterium]
MRPKNPPGQPRSARPSGTFPILSNATPTGTPGATPTPRRPKPPWLKVQAPGGSRYHDIKKRLEGLDLWTVCEEAQCPNIGECWSGGTATIMLMGGTCTRGCRFCAVMTGKPAPLDPREPYHAAEAVVAMGVDYIVITSVNRDDLEDGGAEHFATCVRELKRLKPDILVEVLIPDFQGRMASVDAIIAGGPDVIAHNVETTRRLTRGVRDARATFDQSLAVLRHVRQATAGKILTKTSIMLGLGEGDDEVKEALAELRQAEVDIVTFGQYLQPSPKHLAVEAFVAPEAFDALGRDGARHGLRVRGVGSAGALELSRRRALPEARDRGAAGPTRPGVARAPPRRRRDPGAGLGRHHARRRPPLPEVDPSEDARILGRLVELSAHARGMEELLTRLADSGRIRPMLPSARARTALVGAGHALEPGDALFGTARDWPAALARGLSAEALVKQAYGKRPERTMPGAVFDRDLGIWLSEATHAGHMAEAVGFGMAQALRGSPAIALCCLGSGTLMLPEAIAALVHAVERKARVVFLLRGRRGRSIGWWSCIASWCRPTRRTASAEPSPRGARRGRGCRCSSTRAGSGAGRATIWRARPTTPWKRRRAASSRRMERALTNEVRDTLDKARARRGAVMAALVEAIRRALGEVLAAKPEAVLMGVDVAQHGGLFRASAGLVERFGAERVLDVPPNAPAMLGMARGMKLAGHLPMVELPPGEPAARAGQALADDIARMSLRTGGALAGPFLVRVPEVGHVRAAGGAGAGLSDGDSPEPALARAEGLTVVAPSRPIDAWAMIHAAADHPEPVVVLEPRRSIARRARRSRPDEVPAGDVLRLPRVVQPGADLVIFAWGAGVPAALEAASARRRRRLRVRRGRRARAGAAAHRGAGRGARGDRPRAHRARRRRRLRRRGRGAAGAGGVLRAGGAHRRRRPRTGRRRDHLRRGPGRAQRLASQGTRERDALRVQAAGPGRGDDRGRARRLARRRRRRAGSSSRWPRS